MTKISDARMLQVCDQLRPDEGPCKHTPPGLGIPCRKCLWNRLRQRLYVVQKGEAWKEIQRESYRRRYHDNAAFREREKARQKHGLLPISEKAAMDRARRAGVEVEHVRREAVYEKSDGRCSICGRHVPRDRDVADPLKFELEHWTPISKGGAHTIDNLWPAHRLCNQAKGDGDVTPELRARVASEIDTLLEKLNGSACEV